MTSVERHLTLEGPSNVRDLGGLPAAGGATTRFGLVYRADGLNSLTSADLARPEIAGIRHVFDLRSDGEAAELPSRLPTGASYERLPMTSDPALQPRTIYERIAAGEIRSYGETQMVDGYVRMLEKFGSSFVRIATRVAEREPLVIHCTAGKDRTGVAAMLLLDLAGVEAEHIIADYALSSERKPSPQHDQYDQHDQTKVLSVRTLLEGHGLDPADFAPLWEARPAVMAATLDELHSRWGGAARYLEIAGLGQADINTARASLLC